VGTQVPGHAHNPKANTDFPVPSEGFTPKHQLTDHAWQADLEIDTLIGIVRTLLGVAGGELIIPTLVLAFGVPIKAAGTLSLLISIPTILVGLTRHRARGAFRESGPLRDLVAPMGLGTVAGAALGGAALALVPPAAVKLLLGAVLIASAVKVFDVDRG
jgi:uncharacterized membrane protein YfcA